ncbi:hypothetical protein HKB16_15570, partial [Vibrio parahaemolyticus]|nr:hypothetical protein [Vibrio parahaemolyticus]
YDFQVEFRTAGTRTLEPNTFYDRVSTTPVEVVVAPAEASRLVVDGPATVVAGVPAAFNVTAFDRFGNVATGTIGSMTLSS